VPVPIEEHGDSDDRLRQQLSSSVNNQRSC
jgi:hypothetical protein